MNFPTFNVELFGMSCSADKTEGMSKCAADFTQKASENIQTNYDMCRYDWSPYVNLYILCVGLFY